MKKDENFIKILKTINERNEDDKVIILTKEQPIYADLAFAVAFMNIILNDKVSIHTIPDGVKLEDYKEPYDLAIETGMDKYSYTNRNKNMYIVPITGFYKLVKDYSEYFPILESGYKISSLALALNSDRFLVDEDPSSGTSPYSVRSEYTMSPIANIFETFNYRRGSRSFIDKLQEAAILAKTILMNVVSGGFYLTLNKSFINKYGEIIDNRVLVIDFYENISGTIYESDISERSVVDIMHHYPNIQFLVSRIDNDKYTIRVVNDRTGERNIKLLDEEASDLPHKIYIADTYPQALRICQNSLL